MEWENKESRALSALDSMIGHIQDAKMLKETYDIYIDEDV